MLVVGGDGIGALYALRRVAAYALVGWHRAGNTLS